MRTTRIYAMSAGLAVIGLVGGLWWYSVASVAQACQQRGSVAGGSAAIGGPFTLVTEDEETVTEDQVITGPTLIYFGYTFCPDVCPMDAARNAEAVDLLAERGYDVEPVFITVDPARDTPEVLKEFTDYMHPDMLGLTGSAEQVALAAKAYRVYYAKQDGDDPDYYLMNHSAYSYLMLPGEGFAGFFRGAPGVSGGSGATAEEVADGVACLIEQA